MGYVTYASVITTVRIGIDGKKKSLQSLDKGGNKR